MSDSRVRPSSRSIASAEQADAHVTPAAPCMHTVFAPSGVDATAMRAPTCADTVIAQSGAGAVAAEPPPIDFYAACNARLARLHAAARTGNCSVAVDSFFDLFMWGIDLAFKEQYRNPQCKQTLAAWAHHKCTLSTAYSGIAAPETACAMLSDQLRIIWPDFPDGDILTPQAMCEIDSDAVDELLARQCDSCVFGDLNTFWHPKALDTVGKAWACPASAWDMLGPAVKAGKAVVSEAYCHRHKRVCTYPSCTVHIAGSSCTDHSAMGDQLSVDGHTSIPKLCWFGMRRLKKKPVVIIENVPALPESIIL